MIYYVTVKIEETIEVEADDELEAVAHAVGDFDPLSHDTEVVEVWSNNDT